MLSESVSYFIGLSYVIPYGGPVEAVQVDNISEPSGIQNLFYWGQDEDYGLNPNGNTPYGEAYTGGFTRTAGGSTLTTWWDTASTSGTSVEVWQSLDAPNSLNYPIIQTDYFDLYSQNNTSSTTLSAPWMNAWYADKDALSQPRQLGNSPYINTSTTTTTSYNFLGNPLDTTVTEAETLDNRNTATTRTATTSYAYWDSTKYFQQKAIKDPGGRISFTDYYTNTDPNLGNRGQKYQVFDPKYGGTSAGGGTGTDGWRYTVSATANQHSGQFSYDSKGRLTSVLKLQAATPNSPPYRYVTTTMAYGADNDGSWGQVTSTLEDAGGINHTTAVNIRRSDNITTNGFTAWGKPNDTVDGAGHEFETSYDSDGKVNYVSQVGFGNVVTYTYGQSSVSLAQPITVVDNLTNVTQQIAYTGSGGGVGQPSSVQERRGVQSSVDNECDYTYAPSGDRLTASYKDGLGGVLGQWGYYDYIMVGSAIKNTRAFRTLCKLDGNGNRTSDEFHYSYDTQGRIIECAFAQTPTQTVSDSGGWYDTKLAFSRCRAHYEYDPGGRLYWIGHYWDTLSGNSYSSAAIMGHYCDYEINDGLNRGVKTDSKYESPSSPGSSTFSVTQTDSYSYDSALDYLAGASYGDGQPNANPTWSYDAGGSRNDTVADDLNRPQTIGGVSCTSDILGNRLTFGSKSYGWDQLNRLSSYNGSTSYSYRADGMRIYKSNSSGATIYRYDGQMGMEDIDFAANGSVSKTTDYGIGARGVDGIFVTQNGATSAAYPLYDAHGNMISTLARNGSGGCSIANVRTFDAWGIVRVGAQTGDPKGRFCASLGHKQDDESALVYMRARYFEPASGRFLSEDPSRNGANWLAYAADDPVGNIDQNGRDINPAIYWYAAGCMLETVCLFGCLFAVTKLKIAACTLVAIASCAAFACAINDCPKTLAWYGPEGGNIVSMLVAAFGGILIEETCATAIGLKTPGARAVAACFSEMMLAVAYMMAEDMDD